MKRNSPHIKPLPKNDSNEDTNNELTFINIFDAVNEKSAGVLKEHSDMLISVRDILTTRKISNPAEHKYALKRIEQLLHAKANTIQGEELNILTEIVCKYEDNLFS